MDEQSLDKLTETIIGCAYQVSNTLGIGFVEKVNENSHVHEMRKSSLQVHQQYPIKVVAVSALNSDHIAQVLNYLWPSRLPVCLLTNFGRSKIQVRRPRPSPNWKATKS